jgi:hypothetical protein
MIMATRKTVKTPVESDYVIPGTSKWVDPPCAGAVGSPVNLLDVEAQYKENENAFREKRKVRAIAVHCPFCPNYHLAMQPPVEALVGGEVIGNYIATTPPPPKEPVMDEVVLARAVKSVSASPPVEEANSDDTTGSDESDSDN